MENRQLCDSKKITEQLIGMWLAWGLLFVLIYSLVAFVLALFIQEIIVLAVILVILQGTFSYLAWKQSTKSVFKNFTMEYTNLPIVMKNIFLFTLVACLIIGAFQYYSIGNRIDQSVAQNKRIMLTDAIMSSRANPEEMLEYQRLKEEVIKQAKKKAQTYTLIIEAGMAVAFLAVLPLERKEIIKYL